MFSSIKNKRYFFTSLLLSATLGFTYTKEETYENLVSESTQLEIIYSENGAIKHAFSAQRALHYNNGDQAYLEGVHLSFYKTDTTASAGPQLSVTGKAQSAYYWAERKIYELRGDVEIKSLQENRQLNTDMLYIDAEADTFYTDMFIRVETEHDILTGEGLTAKRDLSHYSVSKPEGNFNTDPVTE